MNGPATDLQIILLTYRTSTLGDEIFESAARLAERRRGVQLVVAWGGGEGPGACRWRDEVAAWRRRGADLRLVEHPAPLERVRLALEQPAAWVLHLADDDPIGVNYLRAMADGVQAAAPATSALLASHHVQDFGPSAAARRLQGWRDPGPTERLIPMLARPGEWGTLFWAAYRREVVAAWLGFALELPFQPSYLDQFLPHLAAIGGPLEVLAEDTVLLKDERHWQDEAAIARTNARYCPQPAMALFHEWFWAADLWDMIQRCERNEALALAMKRWARQMMGYMLERFEQRGRILQLPLDAGHAAARDRLRPHFEWLAGPDSAAHAPAGMDRLAVAAHALREDWLAADAAAAGEPDAARAEHAPAAA